MKAYSRFLGAWMSCIGWAIATLSLSAVGLPEGYTELVYIESTKTDNNAYADQYLDTGCNVSALGPKLGFYFDFVYQGPIGTGGLRIMGSATRQADNYGLFLGGYQGSTAEAGGQMYFCNSTGTPNPMIPANQRALISIRNKRYTCTNLDTDTVLANLELNGTSYSYFDASILLGSVRFANKGGERADLRAPLRIYRFKVYNEDTLLHDFVPAKNAQGEAGLYDVVGDKGFRGSEVTGKPFAAGSEVVPGGVLTVNSELVTYLVNVEDKPYYTESASVIPAGSTVVIAAEPVMPNQAVQWEAPLPAGAVISGDGKMLTFTMGEEDVAVAVKFKATVPNEYCLLTYLESTGSQHIDTGVPMSRSVALEMEMAVTPNASVAGNSNYSGAALEANGGWLCVGDYGAQGAQTLGAYFAKGTRAGATIPYDNDFHYYYCANKLQRVDSAEAFSEADFSSGQTLWLFDANIGWSATHVAKQRIRYCAIYTNGFIRSYYVPALRVGDEKPGLYDLASSTFLVNQGSGEDFAFERPKSLTVCGSPLEFGEPSPGYGVDYDAVLGEMRTYTAPAGNFPYTNAEQTVIVDGYEGYTLTLTNGLSYSGTATSTSFVFGVEHHDSTLTWRFSSCNLVTFSSASQFGKVTGAESGFYRPGDTITLTAKPKMNATFAGWEGDVDAEHVLDNPLVVTVGNKPIDIAAKFDSVYDPSEDETSTKGLVVSILGDSYSAYDGHSDGGSPYYPDGDVNSVDKMWWKMVIDQLEAKLGICNAVQGTTLGYGTKSDSKGTSFLSRLARLNKGDNGSPDIIFVFGGANDQAQSAGPGDYLYDPADWTNDNLVNFRPACAALIHHLRNLYPKARIYFVVNAPATADCVYLDANYIESMKTVCAHYDVPAIELHDIERVERHPTAAGMAAIAEQVTAFVQADFAARAAYAYHDMHFYSNDAALRCLRSGKEYVYISTNVDRRITLLARHNMEVKRALVVGGGGAGGQSVGGGGGGGGVKDEEYEEGSFCLKKGDRLTLIVGAGGGYDAVVPSEKQGDKITAHTAWVQGVSGTASVLSSNGVEIVRAGGGGGGGGYNTAVGRAATDGGSGGGGANGGAGGTADIPGYAGAAATGFLCGGGGGASEAGKAGSSSGDRVGGAGGAGVTSDITGETLSYGGGGGGGAGDYDSKTDSEPRTSGAAGDASAGAGGAIGEVGEDGADGFGGGGGGGGYSLSTTKGFVGGKGGNGAVILRVRSTIEGLILQFNSSKRSYR